MTAVRLAHVSDLHLPPPAAAMRGRLRFSKRQLSLWSWRRRGHLQRPEIVAALADALRASAVDHVAITGDIVNFSLPEEFEAAAEWLSRLLPAERISLVPGNHDALVPLAGAQGLDHWAPWTRLDAAGWPFVHRLGGLSLIGLSSALPTAPGLAQGRLGPAQLQRLRACLLAEAGRCRIVLLHHPPLDGAVSARKALRDRRALRAVLAAAGAEALLHGHARSAQRGALPGPGGDIPVLCVPSSTALPSRQDEGARWHEMRFEHDDGGWRLQLTVHRWSPSAQTFLAEPAQPVALPAVTAGCGTQAGSGLPKAP